MKVFITGASGFLGSRLVPRLLQEGHHVCCLVRCGSDTVAFRTAVDDGASRGRLEVIHGSLGNLAAVRDDVRGCDAVIHAAAAMSGGAPTMFSNNVVATRRLIALLPGSRVRRFILISSLGVYAAGQMKAGETLDEDCPLDPEPYRRDHYSYSKIAQERVAWEAHGRGDVPLVVIRPGVIYGPGRGSLSARIGLRWGGFHLRMGGRQSVPYTYVENCAAAVASALAAQGVEGDAFNVIDDDLPTARTVLTRYTREVASLHVVPIPHAVIGVLSRLCESYHRWSNGQLPAVLTPYKSAAQWGRLRYSNAKAKRRLAWSPAVRTEDGLRLANEWSRAQLGAR